ncbi:hypothetical protein POM88_048788 [Heracleum sosnowskyi]|uniref:Uncharacterized protein n=1 Tax=Heracleum sosnowskyi TaxID=360622 RepID=A0AAD8M0Y5_9APIA|nr:hypothetical protein POM88_048788 [Heracleum sosnowskyi]
MKTKESRLQHNDSLGCVKIIIRFGGLRLRYEVRKNMSQIDIINKVYSGFGHRITIYAPSEVFPKWTSESPYWISRSSNVGSAVSLDLPPNMSNNFSAMIICCEHRNYIRDSKKYYVKTTTNGFAWMGVNGYNPYDFHSNSCMDIIPRSIFSVTDSDNKIELSVLPSSVFELRAGANESELASATDNILGIHLQYRKKITMTDMYNNTAKGFIRRK